MIDRLEANTSLRSWSIEGLKVRRQETHEKMMEKRKIKTGRYKLRLIRVDLKHVRLVDLFWSSLIQFVKPFEISNY